MPVDNLLWKLSITVTLTHAQVIEKIAHALLEKMGLRSDGLYMDLTCQQIEILLSSKIPRMDSLLDDIRDQIEAVR